MADTATLLLLAAEGRDEYATLAPEPMRTTLRGEADILRSAARIAQGEDDPMYGLIPSWMWPRLESLIQKEA